MVGDAARAVVLQTPAESSSEDQERASRETERLTDGIRFHRQQEAGNRDQADCYLRDDSGFLLADMYFRGRRMDGMEPVYLPMGMRDSRHNREIHCVGQAPSSFAGTLSGDGLGGIADTLPYVAKHAACRVLLDNSRRSILYDRFVFLQKRRRARLLSCDMACVHCARFFIPQYCYVAYSARRDVILREYIISPQMYLSLHTPVMSHTRPDDIASMGGMHTCIIDITGKPGGADHFTKAGSCPHCCEPPCGKEVPSECQRNACAVAGTGESCPHQTLHQFSFAHHPHHCVPPTGRQQPVEEDNCARQMSDAVACAGATGIDCPAYSFAHDCGI